MSKSFWGIIIAIIVVFGVVFAINGNKSLGKAGTPTNHIEGNGSSGVTLVEYGDYQCPFCGQYFPILKQVQQEYNDKIVFQFRNLPLTSLHPNAFAGARAAEAAALQNKFWEMHDLLYQENVLYNQAQQQGQTYNTWVNASDPTTFFKQYAQALGLNVSQFQADYASIKVNDLINADLAQFPKDFKAATGAYDPRKDLSTPTFFLDGKRIQVGESVQNFEKVINAELTKKGSATDSGTTSQTQSTTPSSTKSGQ